MGEMERPNTGTDAARRLGELIALQKATLGLSAGTGGSPIKGARVDKKPTLAEAGIDKKLAHTRPAGRNRDGSACGFAATGFRVE
jgi:hypothetical protein